AYIPTLSIVGVYIKMEEKPPVHQRVHLISKEPKYGPKCDKPRISFWWCFTIEHLEKTRILHRSPKLVMDQLRIG
ncbi:15895_t:CDS:1, partial [Funneliformis caledonium]